MANGTTCRRRRCFWYQVQKVTPAQPDPALGATFRSMTVYVNRPLDAKTLLDGKRQPRGPERRADLPVRRQRDPADVFREVRGVVARNSGEWRVSEWRVKNKRRC